MDNTIQPQIETAIIETPRLMLRPAVLDDAAELYPILSDTETMQYDVGIHRKPSDTEEFLQNVLSSPSPTNHFIIVLKTPTDTETGPLEGKSIIGTMGFWHGNEIAFCLSRASWGKGYGTEALRGLLAHTWAAGTLRRVVADVDPRNERCLAMLRKCGFRFVAAETDTMCTHVGWCDSVYLEVTRPGAERKHLAGFRAAILLGLVAFDTLVQELK
ncbi:MAG: hypothetical protein M1829_006471 [Trizodia sp. TS-e1964]|nr:MAG: hypothetical protein M1829_006471 [Trizodia sp. TS-e1964]